MMGRMDFESLSEYLDDRYTPAEVVELLDIPMSELMDALRDFIIDNRLEVLAEITDEGDEIQLELGF